MKVNIFKNKNILVAGGTGMVGQQLVPKLLKLNANVTIASLDDSRLNKNSNVDFYQKDLININNCLEVTKGKDIVFNLLGVTGSPKINITNPGSFMMSNLYCAVNLLYASQKNNVKRYMYTSTYGVYGESSIMKEDFVWKTFPSEHDKYAGWAKRMGELQVEAYKKEFNFESLHVIRPANIYGPHININPKNSMVIGSLIRRIIEGENPLNIWGDGSNIRDFVYSEDVAEAMIQVIEKNINIPINIGSGKGTSIKNLVEAIVSSKYIKNKPSIKYDSAQPSGDKIRILDTSLANSYGINCNKTLNEGIDLTLEWYLSEKNLIKEKYNYFA